MKIGDTIYTTDDCARILGLSRNRILQMIEREELPAYKMGKQWIVREDDLKALKRRKVGRPRKGNCNG